MKKGKNFPFGEKERLAFDKLKMAVASHPILAMYNPLHEVQLRTDASDVGVLGILLQKHPESWKPISYNSQSLNNTQRRIYTTTERELWAVINSIEKFRPYLSQKFTVVTDHSALVYFRKIQNPSSTLGRWAVFLSQWDFEVIHRKGKLHADADWLSRNVFEDSLSKSAGKC